MVPRTRSIAYVIQLKPTAQTATGSDYKFVLRVCSQDTLQ